MCYATAVSLGHVEPLLPMISDCLVLPPEGPLARWGLVTAVNLLALNVLLTRRWLRWPWAALSQPFGCRFIVYFV